MKIEAPRFEGEDPYGWCFTIQEFFDFHSVEDANRLKIVALHLEGVALEWYRWMKSNNLFLTWPNLLDKIKRQFAHPNLKIS